MSYEVTATRKRPRSFDGLVGQEFVVATLKSSLERGRIAHAYLFAGPRGVGKTSAARIMARALNNPEGPGFGSSLENPDLDDISRGRAIDVIEIDGASNTSVNDVRAIKDEVLFPPQSSRYKIYIIDEVHMLSNSAFNALLKTIEEPPPYVIFIFATTEIHKVPATIRSRCQQFNFRLISIDLIQNKLHEACVEMGVKADSEALFWIAKEGTGSLRDSYTLFDQVLAFSDDYITLEKIREKLGFIGLEQLSKLAELAWDGKSAETLEILHSILQSGISVEQCIIDLSDYYRGILFVKAGVQREALLGSSIDRYCPQAVSGYSLAQIERIVALFLQLYRDVRYSLDPRTELELAIVRLSRMRFCLDAQELHQRFIDMEQRFLRDSHVQIEESPPCIPVQQNKVVQNSPCGSQEIIKAEQDDIVHFKSLFTNEKPMLQSLMDGIQSCRIEKNTLHLEFDSAFAGIKAREESSLLLACAQQLWPDVQAVDTVKSTQKVALAQTKPAEDPEIALVKEVFRAEICEEK